MRLYARVSTEEQAATGFSLGAQRERLEAFCLSQGWEIAGCYIDEGVSAKDLKRPQFQRMMADVAPGEVVLVYKLDRLTRSVRDLDDLLKRFDQQGVKFRSATEQFDTTTATGRLFIRMVAEMAQWERETIAERTAFGKLKKAQEGEWPGGRVPIGYITVPSGRQKAGRILLQLAPDPARSHLIPMIFDRYLTGHGIRSIAAWLNTELGARTRQGCTFHQLSISRILTNPLYCGDVVHGRRAKGPEIRVPGSHEPLVSREAFERAQLLLAVHKSYAPRQATGIYPLSGVAKCGICGGRVDGQQRTDHNRSRTYRCHNYMTGAGCGAVGGRSLASVSARHVEERLITQMALLTPPPTALAHLLSGYLTRVERSSGLPQAEQKRMAQDLAAAESAIDRWKRLFASGYIPADEYLAEIHPHRERAGQLRERLAAVAAQVAAMPGPQLPRLCSINLRNAWAGLEPPQRKALLQQFVQAFKAQIVLFPDRQVQIRPQR